MAQTLQDASVWMKDEHGEWQEVGRDITWSAPLDETYRIPLSKLIASCHDILVRYGDMDVEVTISLREPPACQGAL